LQSLVNFYEKERIWIADARKKLQRIHSKERPPFEQLPSPPATEVDGEAETSTLLNSSSSAAAPTLRKRESVPLPPASNRVSRKVGHKPPVKPGGRYVSPREKERIASAFEQMVELRLRSCERLLRLVRRANRPGLEEESP